jgi:hypothetical protein
MKNLKMTLLNNEEAKLVRGGECPTTNAHFKCAPGFKDTPNPICVLKDTIIPVRLCGVKDTLIPVQLCMLVDNVVPITPPKE